MLSAAVQRNRHRILDDADDADTDCVRERHSAPRSRVDVNYQIVVFSCENLSFVPYYIPRIAFSENCNLTQD